MRHYCIILLFTGLLVGCSSGSENSGSERDINIKNVKVSLKDAEVFMQKRCKTINQALVRKKTVNFNGTKLFMFMTVGENGNVCISTISENALEILAADCGTLRTKIKQWNDVIGIEVAPSKEDIMRSLEALNSVDEASAPEPLPEVIPVPPAEEAQTDLESEWAKQRQ